MNKKLTILHAEDDPNDVLLIERAFRKANFNGQLIVINDGEQAISYLKGEDDFSNREKYPFPNLLVMDLKLPRKSGLEVVSWIRNQPALRRLPIALLTSSRQPGDINSAYDSGVNCYLLKPVNFDDLVHTVKTLDLFWLQMNQPPEMQNQNAPFD